jgi:hypothetical protein
MTANAKYRFKRSLLLRDVATKFSKGSCSSFLPEKRSGLRLPERREMIREFLGNRQK